MYFNLDIRRIAHTDFSKALGAGVQQLVASWVIRKNNRLQSFEEVYQRLPSHGRRYIGLQTVAIEAIVGSVGRCPDFDIDFRPRRMWQWDRWKSIENAYCRDINFPPVDLYKVGEEFFVVDGHHRVSVARAHDQVFIDAYVTEFETFPHIASDEKVSA